MEFKVRKGLEAPLKIKGMFSGYFYIFSGVCCGMVMIGVSLIMSAVRGGISFFHFMFFIAVMFFILIALRVILINKSRYVKLRFSKKTVILSGRDFIKF